MSGKTEGAASSEIHIGPSLLLRRQGQAQILEGSLTITRDQPGLALARTFCAVADSICARQPPALGSARERFAAFVPFADEASALSLGGLTVENHETHVSLWGTLQCQGDEASAESALALRNLARRIVVALEALPGLPDAVTLTDPGSVGSVKNPFAQG